MDENRDFADGIAFIDGQFVPLGEARIPLTDRGFTRSDATYDALHVWSGYMFRLEDHLDRFERNCSRLRLAIPLPREEIRSVLLNLVRMAGLNDAFVSFICTRGVPPKGTRDPRISEPRFYAYATPFVWIQPLDRQAEGLRLHLSRIVRIPPSSVDPTTKNFHWNDLTAGLFKAYEGGYDTEVLSDGDGNITEGPGFNIFIIESGQLSTPAAGVFDGMTRRTVIELAREMSLPVEETTISFAKACAADEVFLTTTVGGVLPVTNVEGRVLGNGRAGPITWALREEYWARKARGWHGTAIAQD